MVFARSAARFARPASSLLSQRVVPRTSAFSKIGGVRTLTASSSRQGKVLLCLYDVSTSQLFADSWGEVADNNTVGQ